jgi:hypothetical protein
MGGISRKITVRSLGAQTRNVKFLETGITGQTDYVVARYSASNTGIMRASRFRLGGNAVKVNGIWKLYPIFAILHAGLHWPQYLFIADNIYCFKDKHAARITLHGFMNYNSFCLMEHGPCTCISYASLDFGVHILRHVSCKAIIQCV